MQLQLFTANGQRRAGAKRKAAGKTYAQPWDLWNQPAQADQEMALMFLDIRNFTPLTGLFKPADVVHLVGKFLSVFQRVVRNHHGRIIETTGDGFYAAFGFDREIGPAVDDAVRAGTAIMRQLEVMNSSYELILGRRIEVGIGIHAGNVAMGKINLNGAEHLLVMGHAVNIAARLQNATKLLNNNFVISSTVFELLSEPRAESEAATIRLKGLTDELEVRMLGEKYAA
jgi:adenylate cyclase